MKKKSENTFITNFKCTFIRDGHMCYEELSIELPKNYNSTAESKETALAIESAIGAIKAQKGYDKLVKMTLIKWNDQQEDNED
jgi:hypothetical protein